MQKDHPFEFLLYQFEFPHLLIQKVYCLVWYMLVSGKTSDF